MDSRRLGLQPMTLSIFNKRCTSCGTVAKQINMLSNGIRMVDHYCEKDIRKTPAQINTVHFHAQVYAVVFGSAVAYGWMRKP